MGLVLSLWRERPPCDTYLDFKSARPTVEPDVTLHAETSRLLGRAHDLLRVLREMDASNKRVIGGALAAPSDAGKQDAALDAVLPNVRRIEAFYQLAQELTDGTQRLVTALLGAPDLTNQQALAKQFADIMVFVLEFDAEKISRPELQNEYSYFRRALAKGGDHPELRGMLSRAKGGAIALFLADNVAMLSAVVKGLRACEGEAQVLQLLGSLANICCSMVMTERVDAEEALYCLRAMVGACIAFDHMSHGGVFARDSPIPMATCVKQLTARGPEVQPLLNALRYSTRTYGDSAPSTVRKHVEREEK